MNIIIVSYQVHVLVDRSGVTMGKVANRKSVQVSNVELLHLLTTRMCNCTECQKHSVQDKNHSVQTVPSVTLGIKHSVNGDSAQFVLALSIGKTLGVVYLYRVFSRHLAQCHTRYKFFMTNGCNGNG
jgi:hypothetical protein